MKNTHTNHNPITQIANLLFDSTLQCMIKDIEQNVAPNTLQWLQKQFFQAIPLEQLSKIQTYSTVSGILLKIPGVVANDSPAFDAVFRSLPDEKLSSGYIEIGEWDRQSDSYPWEGQVTLLLGPDNQVWSKIGDLADIPNEQ